MFYSKVLDESNPMSLSLREIYGLINIKKLEDIQTFITFENQGKLTYLTIVKNFHFDKFDYKKIIF